MVKNIVSGPKVPDVKVPEVKVPTSAQDAGAEKKTRAEAGRKARAAALARQGRRSTLLTGPQLGSTQGVKTARRTLLGS